MLELRDIHKHFPPDKEVLRGISLIVPEGEIACLLGPSGCGKSTLLRIVAGLETPDHGTVHFNGEDVTGQPPHRRRFGLMFQDYALFPHMTVAGNIAYGLQMAGLSGRELAARVAAMLDLVNLEDYGARAVDALSGGEQQRVALARTLAPSPRLLLLDEPLANLDRLLREELEVELRVILKRVGVTTLFVTHDQEEAFALADHIVVMNAGRIEQQGLAPDVYRHPANTFVASFLGFQNLLPATLDTEQTDYVRTAIGRFRVPGAGSLRDSERGRLLIPPEAAVLVDGGSLDGAANAAPPVLRGRVVGAMFRGSLFRLQVTPDDNPEISLRFEFRNRGRERPPGVGDRVALQLDEGQMTMVPEGSVAG